MLFYLGSFGSVYIDNVCVSKPTLSTPEVEVTNNQFMIFPNPVKSQFYVNAPAAGNLDVISLDGKVLISAKIKTPGQTSINVENLSAGIYICRYSNNNEVKTLKLVKQ